MRKLTFWFPTWSDTSHAVPLQKMARGLRFRILKEAELFYLRRENEGAEHAVTSKLTLRLCFHIFKLLDFS